MSSDKPSKSVFGVMAGSTAAGAAVGAGIGIVTFPAFAAPLALGGAMTGAAIGAAFFLFAGDQE